VEMDCRFSGKAAKKWPLSCLSGLMLLKLTD